MKLKLINRAWQRSPSSLGASDNTNRLFSEREKYVLSVAHQILSVVGKRLVDENLSPSEIAVEIVEEAAIDIPKK